MQCHRFQSLYRLWQVIIASADIESHCSAISRYMTTVIEWLYLIFSFLSHLYLISHLIFICSCGYYYKVQELTHICDMYTTCFYLLSAIFYLLSAIYYLLSFTIFYLLLSSICYLWLISLISYLWLSLLWTSLYWLITWILFYWMIILASR